MHTQKQRRCRVCVVDDEVFVRDVARQLLERLGPEVTLATGVDDARLILAAQTEPFDIVLVDVSLTLGRDPNLLGEIARQMPACHLVAISGYDSSCTPVVPGHEVRFLQKPFTIETVRRLLSALGFGDQEAATTP